MPITCPKVLDQRLAYAALAIFYGLWFTFFPVDTPLTQPDSGGYLHFSSMRTAGYPYFLWLVKAITGDFANAVYLQIWIYVAALYVLGRTVLSATGSGLLAAGIVMACMINPELNKYHFILLTESVFISLTILIIALLVQIIYRPRWRQLAGLGALTGLAIAVRPVGYAFLPLLPVLLVLLWPVMRTNPRRFIAAALIPVIGIILLEKEVYTYHHGLKRNSLIGIAAFGKAGIIATKTANPYPENHPYHKVWHRLEVDLAPVRMLVKEAPGFAGRNFLANSYEVFIEYQFAQKEIQKAAKETHQSHNNVMKDVGIKRLMSAPMAYIQLVASHYRGLWTLYGANHPATSRRLNAYIAARRPLPLKEANGELSGPVPSTSKALFLQPAMLMLWIMTLVAMTLLAFQFIRQQQDKALVAAGICALMINGNFLLVALTGVSIPRYTIAMWPAMMTTGTFLMWAIIQNTRLHTYLSGFQWPGLWSRRK